MATHIVNVGATVYIETTDGTDEQDIELQARTKFLQEAHTYSRHDIWAEIVEEQEEEN